MSIFLSAGDLISNTGCVVGDYKIEWRLDSREGTVVLISGNTGNTDIEIDARHPLVDEIVIGGTLYPVIIYSYLDGSKYTSELEEGAYYSPDLYDCLDPIIVEVVDCSTVLDATTNYQYNLTRESGIGEKSRSIKFNLGATINYVAWELTALQIADRLDIYYCTTLDPDGELIDSMLLGFSVTQNTSPTNYPRQVGYDPNLPVTPIAIASAGAVKYVSDLTSFTYQVGDWLKFEISGNIDTPLQNDTKWTLRIQCLETIDESNNFADCGKIDLTSLTVTDNTVSCRKELQYKTIDSLESVSNNSSIFLRKYFHFIGPFPSGLSPSSSGSSTSFYYNGTDSYIQHRLSYNTTAAVSSRSLGHNLSGCIVLSGTISVYKNSADLVLTFTNSTDYDFVKANIEHVQSWSRYTDFLAATSSDIDYYGFYFLYIKEGINCDTITGSTSYHIHWGSSIIYNENISITFTVSSLTNGLATTTDPCNTVKSSVDNYVSLHNALVGATIDKTTSVRASGGGGALPYGLSLSEIINDATQRTASMRFYTYSILMNSIIDLTSYGFCNETDLRLYLYYDRLNMADTSNYTLERLRSLETNICADTQWDIRAQEPSATTEEITTLP